MTNVKPQSKWAAAKKMLLALPLLALLVASVPSAQADDHYGRARGEYRHHHRGYYHGGRYYHHRGYYYRHGRRYPRYYGIYPAGVSVNIGL